MKKTYYFYYLTTFKTREFATDEEAITAAKADEDSLLRVESAKHGPLVWAKPEEAKQ